LDEKGFYETKIFVSGDLDEFKIDYLLSNNAPIDGFGIGTKLITGANYNSLTKEGGVSALNGVYKLVEKIDRYGNPIPKIKTSEHKVTLPARKQVYRKVINGKFAEDVITLWDEKIEDKNFHPLLIPIMINGEFVYDFPETSEIRKYCEKQLSMLPECYKRINNSKIYPVKISPKLAELTERLVRQFSNTYSK
jgi:nicotinate phosphoribosyltransferase